MLKSITMQVLVTVRVDAADPAYDLLQAPEDVKTAVSRALQSAISRAEAMGHLSPLSDKLSIVLDFISRPQIDPDSAVFDPPADADLSGYLPEHCRHSYSRVTCPICETDWTTPGNVVVYGANQSLGYTRLSGDGSLQPDASNILAEGQHLRSECAQCCHQLEQYEV